MSTCHYKGCDSTDVEFTISFNKDNYDDDEPCVRYCRTHFTEFVNTVGGDKLGIFEEVKPLLRKTYTVTVQWTGTVDVEVEAFSDDEAAELGMEEFETNLYRYLPDLDESDCEVTDVECDDD